MLVAALDGEVFPHADVLDLLAQGLLIQQIAHAERLFHVSVGVRGGNAAHGGAELLVGKALLLDNVEQLVVGHTDLRSVADDEIVGGDGNTLFAQGVSLVGQVLDIDDHSGAHDVHRLGPENTGGEQIENEFAALVDNGMSRVVAALITDDHIVAGGEQIDHSAFTLVAPVNTYNRCKHCKILLEFIRKGGLYLLQNSNTLFYSTVTDFARFLGLSISQPFSFAT